MIRSAKRTAIVGFAFVLVLACGTLFCADPVPDAKITAAGGEIAGYPVGQFHRPGQNCTACHREDGEASDFVFSMAGTIFAAPTSLVGVENAEVQLTDSVGTTFIALTNCVGNFFVKPTEWDPKFPVLVRIRKGQASLPMTSPIGRERSCGACHLNHKLSPAEDRQYMPHLALFGGDEPNPAPLNRDGGTCRADASVPGYVQ